MFICGTCGKTLACLKTGAKVYFEEVDSTRSCEIYGCRTCKTKFLGGFGGWYKDDPASADVRIGITISYPGGGFL